MENKDKEAQNELKEMQERSEEALSSLRTFYETEKEKLE